MRRNRRHRPVNRYKRIKRIRWVRVIIALLILITTVYYIIQGVKYLIDKIPESITIDVKTNIEEERIRDIIREELIYHDNEMKKTSQIEETSVQATAPEQESAEVANTETKVTSRGMTTSRETSSNLGTYRLTHYYPRRWNVINT